MGTDLNSVNKMIYSKKLHGSILNLVPLNMLIDNLVGVILKTCSSDLWRDSKHNGCQNLDSANFDRFDRRAESPR